MLLTIFNHNGPLMMGYMILIMTVAIICVLPQFNKNSNSGLSLLGLAILTIALSVYPIQCGDFIYVGFALQKGINFTHLEDFYQDLWFWNNDYSIWRMIVFGGATILLVCTIMLLKLNKYFACFIFVITEMFMFGNLRNMLGFMAMFFSVALLFFPNKFPAKIFTIFFAVIGFLLTIPLHRSMWMYELLLIISFVPFGKRIINLSLYSFPILWGSVFVLSQIFLILFADPEIIAHSEYYIEGDRPTTLMKNINEIIRQTCYLYLFSLIVKQYIKKDNCFPPVFNFLIRYAYVLIYIGLLFCGQKTGGWLYERFIGAGEIALMFVMMYYFHKYPRTKGVKIAFGGLIYYLVYQILYISIYASHNYISRFNTITL